MKVKDTTWIKTDPDARQYGRFIEDKIFEFKEFDRNNFELNVITEYGSEDEYIDAIFDNPKFWVQETIDLTNYTEKEIRSYISVYYDSLEQLKEIYGAKSDFIIAECIFEIESNL